MSALSLSRNARGAELDLARYKLVQAELAAPGEAERKQSGIVEHRLRFDGFDGEISLSCSVTMRSFRGGEPEQAGFDPSTLKLAWLDPRRLISASWGTFALGQGRYSQEGHLIILFDGEHFHELFRDMIYAYGSAGMADSSARGLDVSFDRAARTLTLTRTDANRWSRERNGASDERGLFEREVHRDAVTVYLGEGTTRHVWKYHLAGERLEFLGGERYADLGAAEHPVELVAKTFNLSVENLRRLNPALAARSRVAGVVRIDDRLGPYVPEREDRISGPGCP